MFRAIFLVVNLTMGIVGHLGVEPAPNFWTRVPVLRALSTSTFHSQHHCDPQRNLGFYTVLWDRLFRPVSPDYPPHAIGRAKSAPAAGPELR